MKELLKRSLNCLTFSLGYLLKGLILILWALYKGLVYITAPLFQKLKRINYQAVFASLMVLWLFGYAVSIIVTELVSGLQIEDIARNSGWGMFHLGLIVLSTLLARKVYKWLEHEK